MTISTGPILVVEDIAEVRLLIEAQLRVRGYSVISAKDGQDALDVIAKNRPALVVSDILMPRMDGFALAHKLRKEPQTASIPIIFLSATYVSMEDERFALNLGAMRFLPKPIDADQLVLAVGDALTGQPQASQQTMSARDFYLGYRQRLEMKLKQKSQQISRNQQQLDTVPEIQRETYRRLLIEAQEQYDEIQRELKELARVMQSLDTPAAST